MMVVEGKIEGPLCYDELRLRRMLRFLEFELKNYFGMVGHRGFRRFIGFEKFKRLI